MAGLDVASGVAGLIALALQVANSLTAYVTAVKDKSKNIQELRDELGLLGEALSLLNDFFAEEELQGRTVDDAAVFAKAIRDCKRRIERIGDSLKPPEGGKLGRAWDRFIWPFEQQEVIKMIENLRRFTHIFHFAANTQGFRMISRSADQTSQHIQEAMYKLDLLCKDNKAKGLAVDTISRRLERMEAVLSLIPMLESTAAEVQEISHSVRVAEEEARRQRKTRILDWFCPKEALHRHADIQEHTTPGTGQWFLHQPQVETWTQNLSLRQDMLCIGNPGTGKSHLTSLLIDQLTVKYPENKVCVVYYYCDYKEKQLQTPLHFLCCIMRQLCRMQENLPTAVTEFYQKTRDDMKDQAWFQNVLVLMQQVASSYDTIFMVVDALDELESNSRRDSFFAILNRLRASKPVVKAFASTRPHVTDLDEAFPNCLKIEVAASPQDLRLHVRKLVEQKHAASAVMDDQLKESIISELCDSAGGMFLLPSLLVNTILSHVTKRGVQNALRQSLSKSTDPAAKRLQEVFASTTRRIKELPLELRRVAKKALMWISRARRPLRAEELQHALAVSPGDNEMDLYNIVPISTIVDSCCGLVEIESGTSIAKLPHFSLGEYLQSDGHGLFEDADFEICVTLLQYLSFHSIEPLAQMSRAQFLNCLDAHPLLDYACLQWGHHAQDLPATEYEQLVLPVLHNVSRLLVMARVRDQDSPFRRKYGERMQHWANSGGAGISVAATFGLTDLIKLLLKRTPPPKLSARNMYGSTPLHEAALAGHVETVQVLIDHGASVLDTNLSESTPLYLAVSAKQFAVVEKLLQYDASSQLQMSVRGGASCVHKAAELLDAEMIAILLLFGANANAADEHGTTPLHMAAQRGNVPICRLLIDAGADVRAVNSQAETPLDFAASAGYAEVIAYLLEKGSNIEHWSWNRWTPLHRAARAGHVEAVSLLLNKGASLLASDKKKNLPIHLAARSGVLEVVAMLITAQPKQQKRQLFHKGAKDATPREVAFFCSYYHIHRYLRTLESEFAAVPQKLTLANQITEAIERGSLALVQEILSFAPEALESRDDDGQPPLHVAIQENQPEIAVFLLEHGASIESTGYHGWRPLHIAASLGNLSLTQLCLAHNASPEARTHTQQTAIHKACSGNNVEVLRALIDVGADPDAKNERGMTGLHVAAHQGCFEIVRYLVLEVGLSVRVHDSFGWSPERWASRSGNFEIRKFLRERMRIENEGAANGKGKRAGKAYQNADGGETRKKLSSECESHDVDVSVTMTLDEEDLEILEDAREGLEEMFV